MPDSDPERKYSEDPENSEQEAAELNDDLDEMLGENENFQQLQDLIQKTNIQISSELGNINVRTFQSADLSNVRESAVKSPLEAYSVPGDEIAEREQKVQAILDENAAAPGDAAQEKKSEWNTKRYLILIGVIGGALTGIIYSVVARSSSGQSDDDIPLSEDLKAQIRQLVAAWQGQSDAAFWGSMAAYVQANKLTLADLVYFMQYTMDLNPLKTPFFWDHAADPDKLAGSVEGLYSTGGSAALLKALPDLQYRGAGLPRYEQAFVGRTAFTDLASKPGPSPVRKASTHRIRPLVDPTSTILQFSATAAFALPEPFGALLSGLISAISSFFGGGGDEEAAMFAAAMKALLGQIQLMLAINEIQAAAQNIEASVRWLADNTQVIADLQGQDVATIEKTLDDSLKSIRTFLDPTTGILSALTTLHDFGSSPLPTDDAKHWQQLRESAFQTLVSGVGTYLTWLRVRLQWQAALETQQAKDGNPPQGTLVYDYFDQFRIATNEWVSNCSQRLEDLYADRKTFVHASSAVLTIGGGWSGAPPVPYGYEFQLGDDWHGWSYDCRIDFLQFPQGPLPVPNADYNYFLANTFGPAFDADYQSQRAMLKGFTDAIADWNKKIAPPKPSNLAAADPDLTKWGADAPQGSNWVAGTKVRYAITNVNGAGTATAGDWGDPVTIGTRAFALVSSIPVDAMGLTAARQLRRQFTDPTGKAGSEQVVAIIANNTDTTYLDNAL
jgi:hypothetical protein